MAQRSANAALPGSGWQVQLLGGFSARNGDVSIERFPARAVQLLLIRLALAAGRAVRREQLIDWLWPGLPVADGLKCLRTAKYELRCLLEPPGVLAGTVLGADRQALWLQPGACSCDAVLFERHVRQHDSAAALALYGGELVPAIVDDVIDAERQRLQALHDGLLAARNACPPARNLTSAQPRRPQPAQPPPAPQLPAYSGVFIGRDDAVRQLLAAAAAGQRLVVVHGLGGCGKTRLCVEAAGSAPGFGFVGFVGLAQCADAALIVEHVRALRQLQAGAASTLDQVVADLEGRPVLLVLDNFEQFDQDAAAQVLATLLARLPQLHLWISTRLALAHPGVFQLQLPPLALPAPGADAVAAQRAPAVALFVARARRARADFHLHARNVAGVVALCRLVEGVPLAVELTAARIRSFTPAALCDAIGWDWSAIALVGPQARQAGRHASIDRLIDWSWQLLSPALQQLLAGLTVFEGGWTTAQATAVALHEDQDGDGCAERLLAQLAAASMLQPPLAGRWQMLRIVRDAVASRLDDAAQAALRRRHRRFFLAMAQRNGPALREAWAGDQANLDGALASALRDGDLATAAALALALHELWLAVGLSAATAGRLLQLADACLPGSATALPVEQRCRLLAGSGLLLLQHAGANDARRLTAAAVDLAGGDVVLQATAAVAHLSCRALSARPGETFGADARVALALAERAGLPLLQARALIELGRCALEEERDPVAAERLFAAAAALLEQHGGEAAALRALPGLLACMLVQQRFADMLAPAVRGLERAQRLGHADIRMQLFNRHGCALDGLRRWRQAITVYQQQARAALDCGMAYHFAFAAWNQSESLLGLRQWAAASRMLGLATRYWCTRFAPLRPDEQRGVDALRQTVREQIGMAAEAAAWAEGETMPLARAQALVCGSY